MADHLMDVPSTNQHTVKPWFDGKIDFSPPVPNLAEIGYPLLGGRLDNIEGRPAAALVYQRRKHYVNVFVMTQADGAPPASYEHNGYHVKGWRSGGLDFLAVSDIGADELGQFAQQFRKADHE
jgi:anti-sigma factor RsiW